MSNDRLTAVIMAGGAGVRMKPLTDLVPKPLLPVGTKPIIEIVIENLAREGFVRIIITLGYRGDMIKQRLGDGRRFGVTISYTEEDRPLGTVGALSLIQERINSPFLVINGDILTDQSLREILEYHNKTNALITMGIVKYDENLRFGLIKRDGLFLKEIEEKPRIYYDIGAGIYAISPEVTDLIPEDCFFDFPDLIKKIEPKERIGCFEISGFWKDIGRPQDYVEVNSNIETLKRFCSLTEMPAVSAQPGGIRIPMAMPTLSYEEAKACFDTVLSTWVNEGQKVREFENMISSYIGSRHAVAFFNGTVALHALMVALGIGRGDEVIVPSLSFVSTATSVLHTGADVVFADIDEMTFNIDPGEVERRVTPRTKAVMVVHYAGQTADIDALYEICRRNNILLIEDAAEALGAEYRGHKVGSFRGIPAMFSFTPTKNITTGEGGIITTHDDVLAERLRLLKNHGSARKYQHDFVGYNYRMTEMQGAIGVEQVKKLKGIMENKRAIAEYYTHRLSCTPGVTPPYVPEYSCHSYMMYSIKVGGDFPLSRDELAKVLLDQGIQTQVYFPPIHTQPVFRKLYPDITLPVCEKVAGMILSLPIHPLMTREDASYVLAAIEEAGRS